MMFLSPVFIVSVVVLLACYYTIFSNHKEKCLLVFSYLFCIWAMPKALAWLIFVTLFSFILGKWITGRKWLLSVAITIIVLSLISGKMLPIYGETLFAKSFIMPLGISFYTLQAISYLVDVYLKRVEVERSICRYALYISFFPKLVSGPIEKSKNFFENLNEINYRLSYKELKYYAIKIVWGCFQKIVVADHATILVDLIFNQYQERSGAVLVWGAIFYGIQLYADFSGYTNIALGLAGMFGIKLTSNFRQPYFSTSIREFWTRWHISLSSWLKEYIYIPLGGSRKGKVRTSINLLITFGISGIWHGMGTKYIVWGLFHGAYQILERYTQKVRNIIIEKLNIKTECFSYRLFRSIITFCMVDFAWIFFRANGLKHAIAYIMRIWDDFSIARWISVSLYDLAIDPIILTTLLIGTVILIIVDVIQEKKLNAIGWLEKQNLLFRWTVYMLTVWGIMLSYLQLYGMDISNFIYAQF